MTAWVTGLRAGRSEPHGFGPADPVADGLEVAVAYPGRLRLYALAAERLATRQHEPLLLGDPVDDVGNGDAIGFAKHVDPPSPVGSPGIAEPAKALGVVAKRRRVLQRVSEIKQRRCRAGMVEVEQAGGLPAAPDAVPRPEVAVADDLTRSAPARTAGPDALVRRAVTGDRIVIAAQEARPVAQSS
jgi:hypothetical protein